MDKVPEGGTNRHHRSALRKELRYETAFVGQGGEGITLVEGGSITELSWRKKTQETEPTGPVKGLQEKIKGETG